MGCVWVQTGGEHHGARSQRGKGGRLGSGSRLAGQLSGAPAVSSRCEGPTPRVGPEEGSSWNTEPVLRSLEVPTFPSLPRHR